MIKACRILEDLRCPFVLNQNAYNIFNRTIEKNGLKQAAAEYGKGIIAFKPLEQGVLTDRYLNGIPEDSRIRKDGRFLKESGLTPERRDQIRRLNDLAAQRGEKLAEMALGWLLQHKEVTSVLIGASKPQQSLDNVKAIHCAPVSYTHLDVYKRQGLDGDGCNPANSSDGQVSTRLQAYLEMLSEGKEAKRS